MPGRRAGRRGPRCGRRGARFDELPLPERIRRGLTLIPEDRQGAGIVPPLSVTHNVTLSSLREHARGLWLFGSREGARPSRACRASSTFAWPTPDRPITTLSGGNQQKAVVARALFTSPRVLLMDEPTRGIDVAARAEMFDLMRRLAGQGLAILYSSSDLKEVVGVADRILVLSNGRLTGEFDGHGRPSRSSWRRPTSGTPRSDPRWSTYEGCTPDLS